SSGAKEQATRGDYRAAVVFGPGLRYPLRRQGRVFSQRNAPDQFASVEVETIERAPRRLTGRIAFIVQEPGIAGKTVARTMGFSRWTWRAILAKEKVIAAGFEIGLLHVWKRGHAIGASADLPDNSRFGQTKAQAAQRGRHADPHLFRSMALSTSRF